LYAHVAELNECSILTQIRKQATTSDGKCIVNYFEIEIQLIRYLKYIKLFKN